MNLAINKTSVSDESEQVETGWSSNHIFLSLIKNYWQSMLSQNKV